MSKIVLDPILTTNNLASINANFVALASELNDKVLYRDNPEGEVNTLLNSVDVNSNSLFNLPTPTLSHQAATKAYVDDTVGDAPVQAAASAAAAAASAVEAAGYAADIGDGTLPLVTPELGDATADSLDVNGAFTSRGISDTASALTLAVSASRVDVGGLLVVTDPGAAASLSVMNSGVGYAALAATSSGTSNSYLFLNNTTNGERVRLVAHDDANLSVSTGGNIRQVMVAHTPDANRYITLTGSNGGNPTIGTSAGSLALSSTIILCGTATGTDYGSIYSQTGQISFIPQGSSANISTGIYSKGNSGIFFATGTVSATQVSINNTDSANRYIILTGSNGGNPTIGVSAGALGLTASISSTGNALFLSGTTPISGGGASGISFNNTQTGIYVGVDAPAISAPKGSLYLRTNGTTTNDRAYINTDGGTTWTALITAA